MKMDKHLDEKVKVREKKMKMVNYSTNVVSKSKKFEKSPMRPKTTVLAQEGA